MSWVVTGRSAVAPLLDQYSGAAVAYSLSQLRTGSELSVVRVRRSSDNTEQDFTAAQVTNGTLATFCGAGDGFVSTWYDQSGNGRNVIQPTTGSQPKIVSSGTLVTHNSQPAIDTNGGKTLYNAASGLNTGAALMTFAAYSTPVTAAPDTNTMFLFAVGINSVSAVLSYFASTGALSGEYAAFNVNSDSADTGSPRLASSTYRRSADALVVETVQVLSTGIKLFQNNSEVTLGLSSGSASVSGNYTPNAITRNAALTLSGLPGTTINNIVGSGSIKISEFIAYNTDQSSVRSAITTAMNSRYAAF